MEREAPVMIAEKMRELGIEVIDPVYVFNITLLKKTLKNVKAWERYCK